MSWDGIGIFVTAVGLLLTWGKYLDDNKYRQSKFYLNEIKRCFKNAGELITEAGNNNIKWHAAIHNLETAVNLSNELSEKQHKHVYIKDYLNVCLKFKDILNSVKSHKFFYGVENYADKEDKELYELSNSNYKGLVKTSRISSESLSSLMRFLYKSDQWSKARTNKAEENKSYLLTDQFKLFFEEPIKEGILTPAEIIAQVLMSRISCLVITDYIKAYEEQRKSP